LCQSKNCSPFYTNGKRNFFYCTECFLIFIPDHELISIEEEKKRYELHNNTISDEKYCSYLLKFIDNLNRIPLQYSELLDFGCGKNNVLSTLLQKKGIICNGYDPHYGIALDILNKKYDGILLGEVLEHIRDLNNASVIIKECIKKEGVILIKTELYPSKDKFADWWYIYDLTHINFFTEKTITVIAEKINKKIFYSNNKNIFLLQ